MSPSKRDMEPFSDAVDEMFTKLGLPDPMMMAAINSEWDQLAGPPWSGRSKPLYMRGSTLVVEASSRSMVAFLRYGESDLVARLSVRFGADRVKAVEINPPGRAD
ncbi:MAG TPA: DUF721 domain-containing protein [Acidimicrobiia bacterium]|nr:DUF721 domain-containing protein [Acidimicrobiia bacterium]